MTRTGIVSAAEIMRRVQESPTGDVKDVDILAVKGKKPITYVPTRRAGKGMTKAELVGEYVRYLTDIHERRKDLLRIPAEKQGRRGAWRRGKEERWPGGARRRGAEEHCLVDGGGRRFVFKLGVFLYFCTFSPGWGELPATTISERREY